MSIYLEDDVDHKLSNLDQVEDDQTSTDQVAGHLSAGSLESGADSAVEDDPAEQETQGYDAVHDNLE